MQSPPSFLSNLSTPCASGVLGFPTSLSTRHHLNEEEQRERNSPQFAACSDENVMPVLSNIYCPDTSSPFVSISRESRRSKQQKYRIGVSTSSLDDMLSFATPLSPAPPHCGFDVFTSVFGGTYEHVPGLQQSFTDMNTSIGALRNTSYNNSIITSNNISNTNDLCSGWVNHTKQGEESEECVCVSQCVESENLVSANDNDNVNDNLQVCNTSLSKHLNKPLESTTLRVSQVRTTVAHTTLGGHRHTQEDAVCIHEGVPFPVECSLLQQQQEQQSYNNNNNGRSDSYNMYGVFDGHNGDRLSNLASLYYLEHFNEALTRSALQLLANHETEGNISPSAGVSISNQRNCTSSNININMNTDIKVSDKSVEEMPITEETIPPQRFVSSALVQALIHLDRTLYDTVHETQRHCIGTTAGVVAFYQGTSTLSSDTIPSYISIANLGDSRAVLARTSDGSILISTVDHRIATHPWEKKRVAECGGCIECDRVDGALQVTRSLGDFIYKLPPEEWKSQREEMEQIKKEEEDDNNNHIIMMDSDHSSCVSEWMNSTVPQVDITAPLFENNRMSGSEDEMNELSPLFQSYSLIDTSVTETNNNKNANNTNNNHRNNTNINNNARSSDNSDSDSFGCKQLKYCSISATPHFDSVPPVIQIPDSDAEPYLTNNIVSNIADVYEAELKGDEFLVLATDGVWDYMSTEDVVAFVRTRLVQSGALSGNRPLQHEREEETKEEKEKEKEKETLNENMDLLPPSIGVSHPLSAFKDSSDMLNVPQDIKYTPPPPHSSSLSLSTSCGRRFSSLALSHANNSGFDDYGENNNNNNINNNNNNNNTLGVRFATPPPQCMGSRREERMNSFRFAIGENINSNNNNNINNNSDIHKTSPCTPTNSDPSTQYCGNKLRHVLQDVTNSLADHIVHDLHGGDNVTILLLVFHSTDECC